MNSTWLWDIYASIWSIWSICIIPILTFIVHNESLFLGGQDGARDEWPKGSQKENMFSSDFPLRLIRGEWYHWFHRRNIRQVPHVHFLGPRWRGSNFYNFLGFSQETHVYKIPSRGLVDKQRKLLQDQLQQLITLGSKLQERHQLLTNNIKADVDGEKWWKQLRLAGQRGWLRNPRTIIWNGGFSMF